MANQTGSFSSISDLMSKLSTFATSNGWTQDYTASDRLFLTNSTVSVAFRWATSSPTYVAMYQHTAFLNSATAPGNHTNDSGTGEISAVDTTLDNAKGFNCDDSNGGTYWFFEDATYIHCVIEYKANWYEHFGFGILNKAGTWTGGEYSYGQQRGGKVETGASDADSVVYHWLLDGAFGSTIATNQKFCSTMRAESLPGQSAGERWILAGRPDQAVSANDRGGNTRYHFQGGFRAGSDANYICRFESDNSTGFNPMYDIKCWWKDQTPADDWYYLGNMKDVRGINVKFFSGGDEITVGSDTWVVFPARYKNDAGFAGADTGNLGIAYKKVA